MHIQIFICTYIDLLVCLCAASRIVHVRRAPDDQPLKAITRCTVCIALALVLFHPSVYAWMLTATRGVNVLVACVDCMVAAFWLLRFFHLSAAGPEEDRSQTLAVSCLLLFAAAAAVVWGASPQPLRATPAEWLNRNGGSAALFVLVVSSYIGGVAAMAMRWSLVYSVVTIRRNLRTALRVLSVALVAELCACVLKACAVLTPLAFAVDPEVLGVMNRVWYVTTLFGVWMLVAGVTHPVTVALVGRLSAVFARRAVFHELGPLWRALHDAFPELALPRTSEGWWTRGSWVRQWRARAYYRRVIEIRDGLVRLTPYYALGVERDARAAGEAAGLTGRDLDLHAGAAVVAAALGRRAHGLPADERCAVPDGGGRDLDSDARWLVSLSRALTTFQASGKVPSDPADPRIPAVGSAHD
ncbi:MAB_1171c family putative transporter [Streptomyces griseoviridis]|uniref:MAB_1171c family putative transporter n=1 Tax=Streptomyces griseoviridis TaxID=45398 RepID=UPI00344F5D40